MSRRSQKKALAARSRAPVLPAGWTGRWTVPGVCFFLAAIIWVVFGQTLHDEFVYDDEDYVWGNPEVARGLTLQGIGWAFTHVHSANWHPLTWISHMLDCQLYGLNPGGHHLTNLLLHTAAAILLFLVLRRMTGFLWCSAFVAAVFAIHPLRVESVAWVSERKDVLSGVFFMLTLWAYVRYARRQSRVGPSALRFAAPGSRASNAGSGSLSLAPRLWTFDYGLVLVFFMLGLLSKPMLVTLPFVLLLLDYWPLHRLRANAALQPVFRLGGRPVARRLVIDKLPLFGLVVASCAVTLFAQTEAILPLRNLSFPLRVGNALISYVTYLGQMFWPSDLAVLYPFRFGSVGVASVALSLVALSLVVLTGISTGVFVLRRHRPYLLTGWLWYLIMLVPVIGLIQVGGQARADRYTYLPQIGLYLLLTWAAVDLCAGWRHRRVALGTCAAIILMALIFCGRAQTAYWRDSESLWTHALARTADNWLGQNNLGLALIKKGRAEEAMAHYQRALQMNPEDVEALDGLGTALFQKGAVDEAITHFQRALEIKPDHVVAHVGLANALFQKGNVAEAIAHYQRALQIKPDQFETQINLALVLATCPQASLRDGKQAVALAQRANELAGGGNPAMLGTLAAAYAETGRFPEAVETAQRALRLAETQSNTTVADALRSHLKFYQAGLPFHYPAPTP